MNKILLWLFKFFGSPKVLAQTINSSIPKSLSEKNFILELKKAKKELIEPALNDEQKASIEKALSQVLSACYKKALVEKSEIIFIARHEIKKCRRHLS